MGGREGGVGGRVGGEEGRGGGGGGREREGGREGPERSSCSLPPSSPPSLFARAPPSLFARLPPSLPPEARVPSLPRALPHFLLYFLKLYNVFNDNVQSIR